MASPDGNKALLSPPAEPSSRRSRPVADLWQGRRSGARRPCSIPVADSAHRRSPAAITAGPLPQGCHEARHRDASPAATHARLFPGDRRRPAAVVPGTAAKALSGGSARKLRQSAFFLARPPMCRLMHPNTPAHCQKERLPKTGSLTGEDCGVACQRLKATWQGLLPFRGRTGNGAVTRHVAGSDVLRQREIFRDHRQPLKGGRGCRGGIRRRKVGMFPAGSEGGTSRPGRDFFRRKEVAVFSPGRSWGGTGRPGEGGLRRSGGYSFQVRRRSVRLSTLPRSVAGRGSKEAMRLPR